MIMATYAKREYLEYTLASLAQQTHRDFELVLCDDGTEGGVDDLIAPYRERFEIVPLVQANAGRSAARNAALTHVTGDLAVFSDDDRILAPDFLARHVAASTGADTAVIGWKRRAVTVWVPQRLPVGESDLVTLAARVGGIEKLTAPLRMIEPGDLAASFPAAAERIELGDETDNFRRIVKKFGDDLADFRFAWVLGTTANLSVRRSLLEEAGGFDTGFRGWGMEDTDLSYRLWRAGARFRVEREAVNYHQIHPIGTGDTVVDNRVRQAGLKTNVEYFARKYKALEAYLFKRWQENATSLDDANDLLKEIEAADAAGGGGMVAAELLRLYARM
jgi:GT2 family glycosyltransferase